MNTANLFSKTSAWEVFMESLDSFSEDFMVEERDQGEEQERDSL